MIFNSLGGTHFREASDKKTKIGYEIYPSSKLSTVCIEPYNSVHSTRPNVLDKLFMISANEIYKYKILLLPNTYPILLEYDLSALIRGERNGL